MWAGTVPFWNVGWTEATSNKVLPLLWWNGWREAEKVIICKTLASTWTQCLALSSEGLSFKIMTTFLTWKMVSFRNGFGNSVSLAVRAASVHSCARCHPGVWAPGAGDRRWGHSPSSWWALATSSQSGVAGSYSTALEFPAHLRSGVCHWAAGTAPSGPRLCSCCASPCKLLPIQNPPSQHYGP